MKYLVIDRDEKINHFYCFEAAAECARENDTIILLKDEVANVVYGSIGLEYLKQYFATCLEV